MFKFRWVDETPSKQNLLPNELATNYNKTTIAQLTTDKFAEKFSKGNNPMIERTRVAPIGVIFYLQDNKVVAEVLGNPLKCKVANSSSTCRSPATLTRQDFCTLPNTVRLWSSTHWPMALSKTTIAGRRCSYCEDTLSDS